MSGPQTGEMQSRISGSITPALPDQQSMHEDADSPLIGQNPATRNDAQQVVSYSIGERRESLIQESEKVSRAFPYPSLEAQLVC